MPKDPTGEETSVFEQVQAVFRKELGLPGLELSLAHTPADIPKWDSLRSMMILRKLEKHFNVRVGVEKAMSIKSVGDLVAALQEKLDHA